MKIDLVINKMSGGGAERVVSLVANYLDEKGYTVRIITFQGGDKYTLNKGVTRVRLHRHPLFRSVVFNGFFSLLWFYRKKSNRPDIINSHIDLIGYMTIPISIIYSLKIIVSEHSNHASNYTFARRLLWTIFYPFVNAVTILTSFDYDYFSKKNKRVVVLPNPCPFKIPETPLTAAGRRKDIIAVGSLERYKTKGFDSLIKMSKSVFELYPDWHLKIVGGGDGGISYLSGLIEELELKQHVTLTGFTDNVQALMSESEVFVLSSQVEGLPMALLESMSQGTACIAYDCPSGPSDIITNEVNGLLIEDQNEEKMLAGLIRLVGDPELRAKFRDNTPKSMAKFSMESIGQKWEDLITSL